MLQREKCSHPVQLGARRGDLLDAELTKLGLELSELLCQIILVLAPERTSLDLARRLQPVSDLSFPYSCFVCCCIETTAEARGWKNDRECVLCVLVDEKFERFDSRTRRRQNKPTTTVTEGEDYSYSPS